MPLLPYFAFVGAILLGMIMLAANAIGPPPPMWFSNNSQGLPQRRIPPPKILTALDVSPSPSEALAFAPIAKQAGLLAKHKSKKKKMEVARPGAKELRQELVIPDAPPQLAARVILNHRCDVAAGTSAEWVCSD